MFVYMNTTILVVLVRGASSLRGGLYDNTRLDYTSSDQLMNQLKPILKECAAYSLPMLCANPDFVDRRTLKLEAGGVAQTYSDILLKNQKIMLSKIKKRNDESEEDTFLRKITFKPARQPDAPIELPYTYPRIFWVGKPFPEIYELSLALFKMKFGPDLELGIEKDKVLCIGDSMSHDIVGAQHVCLRPLYIQKVCNKFIYHCAMFYHSI
jgi:hypothetical protein